VVRADGTWLSLPCKSRRCSWCGPRYWKKYTQRRMMSGLVGIDCRDVKVLCVTAPATATDHWNSGARHSFKRLIERLRVLFPGARLEYWKVGETQRRGLVHYHVIVRPISYLPKAVLERLCVAVGFGRICYVQAVWEHKGGTKGLLGYLGKYLLKDVGGWDPIWGHVVTHSHGWSIDWKPRGDRSGVWQWHPSELDVYLELNRREAVRGGLGMAPSLKGASWPPLTAGLSPPFSLGLGVPLVEPAPLPR
jgi:hypothetical protein